MSDVTLALLGLAVGLMVLMGLVLAPTPAGRVPTRAHGPAGLNAATLNAATLYAAGVVVIGALALVSSMLVRP